MDGADDRALSDTMLAYWANFARTGDPNHEGAPRWDVYHGKPLRFSDGKIAMEPAKRMKLLRNTLKGDPK